MEGLEGFGREKGVVGSGWKREEKDWKGLEERREGLEGVGRRKGTVKGPRVDRKGTGRGTDGDREGNL